VSALLQEKGSIFTNRARTVTEPRKRSTDLKRLEGKQPGADDREAISVPDF